MLQIYLAAICFKLQVGMAYSDGSSLQGPAMQQAQLAALLNHLPPAGPVPYPPAGLGVHQVCQSACRRCSRAAPLRLLYVMLLASCCWPAQAEGGVKAEGGADNAA